MQTGGILRRVMLNLGYLTGGKSVSAVFGLIYLTLSVRALGVEGYGQLVLIYSFALTIATIVKFQTWQPILQYGTAALAEGRVADLRRLVLFSMGLDAASSLVGAVLAIGGIWFIGPWVGVRADALPQASAFGFALLFMVTATPNGLLRLFDRFDLLLVEDNVEAAIRLVGAFLLFLAGGTLTGFLVVWLLSVVASGSVCAILAFRECRQRRVWGSARDLWLDVTGARGRSLTDGFPGIWKLVWSTNATSSLKALTNHVATLLVGAFIGAAEAGLFRIARQIADALAKPIKMLTPVLYPELARLVASGELEKLRAVARRTLCISGLGAAAIFLLILVLGRWALALIGGEQALGAYWVMVLLAGAVGIRIATFALEPTLISLGQPVVALYIQLAAALVFIPAMIVLLRIAGLEGAGGAAVIAAILTTILQYLAVSWRFRSLRPASAAA